MAPFDLSPLSGSIGYALVFLAIGMGFGAALELSGFGDSRKLAAQFYLTDMTVLKVMFTAIIVACVLIFLTASFGLLDFNRVWVNPTYLWPGIVGGLIMGVGFVVGGFCPGTSLVAASTLKVDGIFFVLGVLFGVFLFGETLADFENFFLATFMGRFTLPDWLGLPVGVVVLLVVLMALAMFYAAEICERFFGKKLPWARISLRPARRGKLLAAGTLLTACLVLVIHGQPSPSDRWIRTAVKEQPSIDNRDIFVHPAEVVALRQDTQAYVNVFDMRDERDFNLFHMARAQRVTLADTERPDFVAALLNAPDNVVSFLVSNGETTALGAWKNLRAQGILNVYVIEGGINHWLELYALPHCVAERTQTPSAAGEQLAYTFAYATGSMLPSAQPELPPKSVAIPCVVTAETQHPEAWPVYSHSNKVKLQVKKLIKGGCG